MLAALAVAPAAMGHTWIEQLRNVNDKGEYVGEYGYPRGMISKTDPGFNGFSMNFEIPAYQGRVFIDNSTVLCHENQRQQVQAADKYPRLQAVPGGFIAMRYMENGHITKPSNQLGKPEKGGTVFVYGTTEPRADEKIANVLRWTQDGQGGDQRGILLAMNDFDDGRCYEKNETPVSLERQLSDPNFAMGQVSDGPGNYPLFCETNVQVPDDAQVGKPYTFYWVWQWNTAPGEDPGLPTGKDEYYTTCMDVDVTSADIAMAAEAKPQFDLGSQQDAMSVAVSDFASRTALMTDALQGEVGPIFTGKPSGTGGVHTPANPTASVSMRPTHIAPSPTIPAVTSIPAVTQRPGAAPSSVSLPANDGAVTVTDFITVTVTAPRAGKTHTSSVVAPRRGGSHAVLHKNGARFRGVFL